MFNQPIAFSLLLVLISSISFVSRADTPKPGQILIKPSRVYTPVHFDDNDNAQFVFESWLPSTCYKAGLHRARVDARHHRILLEANQFTYPGEWCATIRSRYDEVVDLGLVPAGNYTIQARLAQGSLAQIGTLSVAEASSPKPDDYLYAPVESFHLDPNAPSHRPVLVIKGHLSNRCVGFIRVQVNRAPGVFEILPITELRSSGCLYDPVAFEERVPLGEIDTGQRFLVHVRSLNGKSINQVIEF